MSDRARDFAMAVDRKIHEDQADLTEDERSAILARIAPSGDLMLCTACHGSGWASVAGLGRSLCATCRGFGAVPA
jgi:hypothetical protein